ncbi:MAG: flagellar basal body protein [Acetobacteraceae bacterium]
MLEGIDLFRLAGSRMRYLAERQNVISRNIANADTPGYAASDLTPFSFDSALTRKTIGSAAGNDLGGAPLALARTTGTHIGPPGAVAGGSARAARAAPYAETPDGNKVSLEEQMMKAANTAGAFSLASAAYAKSVALLKLSIGGR